MSAEDFKKTLESSLGTQLIVSGLVGLIEDEGYSFHETMRILENIKRYTFPALMEMSREAKK